MLRQLDDDVFVSGQIRPEDVAALAARGIRTIVNNRPDGEVPGQPEGSAIQAAADKAGITYLPIPVSQLTREAVAETRRTLEEAERPLLLFCAVGARSTYMWALAQAGEGKADALEARAAAAGHDLGPIRRFL